MRSTPPCEKYGVSNKPQGIDQVSIGDSLKAVKAGDLQRVRKLLAKNPALVNLHDWQNGPPYADVNRRDNRGMTPLHWAAFGEKLGIAERLLKAKPSLLATDDEESTA